MRFSKFAKTRRMPRTEYDVFSVQKAWTLPDLGDYSPRSGANSYKAGNDDVFSLFHAETD